MRGGTSGANETFMPLGAGAAGGVRIAFETALTCLICLETNYILDEDKSVIVAGLVVETAMYIEAMSGNDTGSVNHLHYLSRLKDLRQDREREIIKLFHKRNC